MQMMSHKKYVTNKRINKNYSFNPAGTNQRLLANSVRRFANADTFLTDGATAKYK